MSPMTTLFSSAAFVFIKLLHEKFISIPGQSARVPPVMRKLAYLASAALALVSCETRSDVEIANEENILILGNGNEPKGLDPHLVSGVLESNIIRALFEGLCVEHPSENGQSMPGAAMSWTPNEDFTQWTFSLNPDAKWSDGVPVTAHDFVFAFRRLLSPDPNWPAKYSEMLYFLENGESYHKDHLTKILCGNDQDFPVSWDLLKESNLRGNKDLKTDDIAGKKFEDLNPEQKKLFINSKGLDKLDKALLRYLSENLESLQWGEALSNQDKTLVIERLQNHLDADQPDLWDQAQVGVTAVDDFTLHCRMRGPVPFLPEITKHYTWYPVPRHVILRHGKINTAFASPWTRVENIVSNGPFTLKTWLTNHLIEVEKTETYWDAEKVSLEGIRFIPVSNAYTETRMFGDGQLHKTYTVPSELIPMAREKYEGMLRQEPYVSVSFLRVNTTRPPFDNLAVRRAFAAAVNRNDIVDKILQGGQQAAGGIVPPFGDYVSPALVKSDPELARAELAKSELSNQSQFPEIDLLVRKSETSVRQAEALQAMWEETLGIKVRIVQREWTTYLQAVYDGDFDMVAGGWIGDYLDPTTFLEMWITDGGNNNTGWGSPEFEELLGRAENTADVAKRMKILSDAETILLKDMPIIPIYWGTTNYLLRPEVKNWNPLLLNNQAYKFISIETASE